ncbi:hypothetical protein [Methylocaldum marinum]|uniref:hypothetical protein n=1 Tax=Methylocaldum marinum TaxID=1432792 RepID=UPI001E655284|nr:hypothetical protein [Methylocaldum marinum]
MKEEDTAFGFLFCDESLPGKWRPDRRKIICRMTGQAPLVTTIGVYDVDFHIAVAV